MAPDGRGDAPMQARHQRRRQAPKHAWPEFRQQRDRGAPALDLLVSGEVSAHGARLGICRPAGKPLGKAAEVAHGPHACAVVQNKTIGKAASTVPFRPKSLSAAGSSDT